jgi:hypothetical protein
MLCCKVNASQGPSRSSTGGSYRARRGKAVRAAPLVSGVGGDCTFGGDVPACMSIPFVERGVCYAQRRSVIGSNYEH